MAWQKVTRNDRRLECVVGLRREMVRVLPGANFVPLKTEANFSDQFWLPNCDFVDQALELANENPRQ
jgi:hypothetical protein